MKQRERRIALVGALIGAFAAAYLLVDYVFGSGICLTGNGCDLVRASPYAFPLGIPMPALGLGFYLVAIALLLARPSRTINGVTVGLVAVAWSLAGVAVMAALTGIELFVIHALCSWCLLSAIASVVLAAGAIGSWRRPPELPCAVGARRSSHVRQRRSAEERDARHELVRFTAAGGAVVGVLLVALLAVPALTAARPVERTDVASGARPRLGAGPVEVVVYSDFQCPACAATAPLLTDLARDGSITLTYRYFPLETVHAHAIAAARAAQAAWLQDRFWEFHDELFARQLEWAGGTAGDALDEFESIATDIGLDVARWRADAASEDVAGAVRADALEAERLALRGTPTIFIDGDQYTGPLAEDALEAAVEAAASAAPAG